MADSLSGKNKTERATVIGAEIARLAKEILPDCIVIAGGVHAEAMPERMLRNASLDAVVRGDGEETRYTVSPADGAHLQDP